MGTGIAIIVIVFVTLVFALPVLLHRTETAQTELEQSTVPTTAQHPVVETTGTCTGENNAPAMFDSTTHPKLPVAPAMKPAASAAQSDTEVSVTDQSDEDHGGAHLRLHRQAPKLALIVGQGQAAQQEPVVHVLPMAVGQTHTLESTLDVRHEQPGLTAVPNAGGMRVVNEVQGVAGSPRSEQLGARQSPSYAGQSAPTGTSARAGKTARPTHSASQPHSRLEGTMNAQDHARTSAPVAPAPQATSGRGTAKRVFALVFVIAALVAVGTVVACLLTDLLWAVPVLATAVSLSSLLAVVAINFTQAPAEAAPVQRQAAPARRSSQQAAEAAGTSAAKQSATAQQPRRSAEQRRAHAGAGVAAKLAQANKAAAVHQSTAKQAAAKPAMVKPAVEQPPARPGRVPAPIVVGHDEQTDVIPNLARAQSVLRGQDSTGASVDTGRVAELGTQGSQAPAELASATVASAPGAHTAADAAKPAAASPVMAALEARVAAPELHLGVAWQPSAVPVPTYVNAVEVPRADPAPLTADESSYAMSANSREQAAQAFAEELGYRPELDDAARDDAAQGDATRAGQGPLSHGRAAARMSADRLGSGNAAVNVNDVLARRRA